MNTIIKKAIATEKGFKQQDKGHWTFQVLKTANKQQIKEAVEKLFGVKVASVTTHNQRPKVRQLRGSRTHTRRPNRKIARVSLEGKDAHIDLTKLNR